MIEQKYKLLAINPGSTSTKISLFENDKSIFSRSIDHTTSPLPDFNGDAESEVAFRSQMVVDLLESNGHSPEDIDAFIGRGGATVPVLSGTYEVNDIMLDHAMHATGAKAVHPARWGSPIANSLASRYDARAFIVNPPDSDELMDEARFTGIRGVYRSSSIHSLNQKEIALRYSADNGLDYNEANYIICHIGGGFSITAHSHGKMIDSTQIVHGDGPMAPTRCGAIPVDEIIEMCFSGEHTREEMLRKTSKDGGLVDLLGTADLREVEKRIAGGDKFAEKVFDSMIYQIGKSVGSCAVALKGKVDQVILTGGLANSNYLVEKLKGWIEWIAPVTVMAGEFEMEALAAGALRVLRGEEEPKEYTGKPVWTPDMLLQD